MSTAFNVNAGRITRKWNTQTEKPTLPDSNISQIQILGIQSDFPHITTLLLVSEMVLKTGLKYEYCCFLAADNSNLNNIQ